MNKKEKNSKFVNFMDKVINLNSFLLVGEYIFWLVGGLIVIERMVEVYLNVPLNSFSHPDIFTFCFMWAIVSIPIFISYKMMGKIWGGEDE